MEQCFEEYRQFGTTAMQSPPKVNFFHVSKEFIIQSAHLIVFDLISRQAPAAQNTSITVSLSPVHLGCANHSSFKTENPDSQ